MGDIADEIGFLTSEMKLPFQIQPNQPAPGADRHHKQTNQKPEGEPQGMRDLPRPQRVKQPTGYLPMRKHFADVGRDERSFPIRLEAVFSHLDRAARVVQQRHHQIPGQRGIQMDCFTQTLDQSRHPHLHSEDKLRIARRTVPKEDLQLVLFEAGERTFGRIPDQGPEFSLLGALPIRCRRLFLRGRRGDLAGFGGENGFAVVTIGTIFDRLGRLFLVEPREINGAFGAVPINLHRFPVAKEAIVFEPELASFGA